MTTATTAAVAKPPKKRSAKKAAKKTAKKTAPPGYVNSADVKAELAELATNLGVTSPPSPADYARMLFLDVANTGAGNRRPDGVTEATGRVGDYFRTHKLAPKERDAFLWAERTFSELQNCRCFIQEIRHNTMLLLKTVMAAKGNPNGILFGDVNTVVYETVNYIKAYNMVIDIMAELTATPELVLAKVFADFESVVYMGEACNKAMGAGEIDIDRLKETPRSEIKKRLRSNIMSNKTATLLSWQITAFVDLITGAEK